jgi:hypothetical protein
MLSKTLYLFLLLMIVGGCSQKSEVDKCVDAQRESLQQRYDLWVKNGTVVHNDDHYKVRMKDAEAEFRKECLRAAAGNG